MNSFLRWIRRSFAVAQLPVLSALILLPLCQQAIAQVEICNNADEIIQIAIVQLNRDEEGGPNTVSGWHKIRPGGNCKILIQKSANPAGDGFFYLHKRNKFEIYPRVNGSTRGCIRKASFKRQEADSIVPPKCEDEFERVNFYGRWTPFEPKKPVRFAITPKGKNRSTQINILSEGISSDSSKLPFSAFTYTASHIGLSKRGGGRSESSWYADAPPGMKLCTFRASEHSNQGDDNGWTVSRVGNRVYVNTTVSTCDNMLCVGKKASVYVDLTFYYYWPGTWSDEKIIQAINERPEPVRGQRATRGALPWPKDVKCNDVSIIRGRKPSEASYPIVYEAPRPTAFIRQYCVATADGQELGYTDIWRDADTCDAARSEVLRAVLSSDVCTFEAKRTNLYKRAGRYERIDTQSCRWR